MERCEGQLLGRLLLSVQVCKTRPIDRLITLHAFTLEKRTHNSMCHTHYQRCRIALSIKRTSRSHQLDQTGIIARLLQVPRKKTKDLVSSTHKQKDPSHGCRGLCSRHCRHMHRNLLCQSWHQYIYGGPRNRKSNFSHKHHAFSQWQVAAGMIDSPLLGVWIKNDSIFVPSPFLSLGRGVLKKRKGESRGKEKRLLLDGIGRRRYEARP